MNTGWDLGPPRAHIGNDAVSACLAQRRVRECRWQSKRINGQDTQGCAGG